MLVGLLVGLLGANLTANFIVAGVGRVYYLLALFSNRGDLSSVHRRTAKGLQEATYRALLQVPLVALAGLDSRLAAFACAYSLAAGSRHFLATFRRQRAESARVTREANLKGTAGGAWPAASTPKSAWLARALQRALWFALGVMVPVAALLALPAAGLLEEWAAVLLGFVAGWLAAKRGPALDLATLVARRRGGWWGRARPAAKVALVLVVVAGPVVAGTAAYQSIAPVRREEWVTTRDGVRLATTVYLPRGAGPFPTVLMRTPYGRGGGAAAAWRYALLGFAFVAQDARGRGDSEGDDAVFRLDGRDGVDTINWLLEQPWCDGNVATLGGSALGIMQYLLAGYPGVPDALRAQYVVVGTPELYDHLVFTGGAFRQYMIDGWLEAIGSPEAKEVLLENPTRGTFWNSTSLTLAPGPLYEHVNAKAVHVGGWYDINVQGTIDAFVGYQTLGGPNARGNQTLVMGPWTHGVFGRKVGEVTLPSNAANSSAGQIFETLLRAELLGDEAAAANYRAYPRVHYYVMGPTDVPADGWNEWRYADQWPLPGVVSTSWYLDASGSLSETPPASQNYTSYAFDPCDPAPTLGGTNLLLPAGPYDQRPVEARGDVLTFTSGPLSAPLEIAGRVTTTLHVSSNATDTDFVVKLTDVYPDGRSMLICEGVARARYWNGTDQARLLVPGQVYRLGVDLWSTAYHFPAGHRLRLSVTSSNWPRYDVNPNTGAPLAASYSFNVTALNRVWTGGATDSRVVLPVLTGG